MGTTLPLGKLIKCDDLRSVWKNEALDFTVWLAEESNLNLLGETLGIEISFLQREAPAGAFSIDILAEETNSGRKIIIENQLENSDHDHLGKIITYASMKQAEIIIWIVKRARDEHRQAIEWLNEKTDGNIEFYLLELELWKINDSLLAPKFGIVIAPNNWMKASKSGEQAGSSFQPIQLEYWERFCEYAEQHCAYIRDKHISPRPRSWVYINAGSPKCVITIYISPQKKQIKTMIYFYNKNRDEFERYKLFEQEINEKLDHRAEWIYWKKDSSIRLTEQADITEKADWERQFAWLCASCMKLKEIVDEYKEK